MAAADVDVERPTEPSEIVVLELFNGYEKSGQKKPWAAEILRPFQLTYAEDGGDRVFIYVGGNIPQEIETTRGDGSVTLRRQRWPCEPQGEKWGDPTKLLAQQGELDWLVELLTSPGTESAEVEAQSETGPDASEQITITEAAGPADPEPNPQVSDESHGGAEPPAGPPAGPPAVAVTPLSRRSTPAFSKEEVYEEAVRLAGTGKRRGNVRYLSHTHRACMEALNQLTAPQKLPGDAKAVTSIDPGWRQQLILNQNMTAKAVLANAITALTLAPEWHDVMAFDDFYFGVVLLSPAPWGGTAGAAWTDQEDRLTADWLQHNGIHVSIEIAGAAVQTVAETRRFHPVRNYLDGLEWDKIPRLDQWLNLYLGTEPSDYSAAVGARFLIQSVARIYRPGCKADCCPVLEGPQGALKSSSLWTLFSPWFSDELADLGSKDAAMQTRGVWCIELSELDVMSRAETARTKSFMSRASDRFRPPYAKRLIESPRQCVFAGSVNLSEYLRDETGARRFWPVRCGEIKIDALGRDRNQLWVEAKQRFDDGAAWWLDSAELTKAATEEQAERFDADPWQEPIASWLESRSDASVADILQFALDKAKAHWAQTDKNRVARCLRALGWERYRRRDGGTLEWRYRRPQ